jgi:hypothetical protein
MTGCARHKGLCAYTGTEPDRCPVCHSTWERLKSCTCPSSLCGTSPEQHLAVHERKQAGKQVQEQEQAITAPEPARAEPDELALFTIELEAT